MQLELFLKRKIRSTLVNRGGCDFLPEFISGRRRYLCRSFSIHSYSAFPPNLAVAILLERNQPRSFDSSQVAAQFNLSRRERETVELLVHGLTSKEIANRMNISPNTVKVFLRLIMVKTGVTTRSGLVGRILQNSL